MLVKHVSIRNFRNLRRLDLALDSGLTVVVGANGSGKTNLVDSVFLSLTGRSCRLSSDRDLITLGLDYFRVRTVVSASGSEHVYEVGFDAQGKKVLRRDGAVWRRFGPELARPLTVVFLPDRVELVKGSPGIRRAHIDRFIQALWPLRERTRLQYVKSLAQRNALLARAKHGLREDELSVWTSKTANYAAQLGENRRAAVLALQEPFERKAQALGITGRASLQYRPSPAVGSPEELTKVLLERLERDIRNGFTGVGPHRDDIALSADGRDLRRYGSQGEQRAAILALLLAEREVFHESRGAGCLLLLDDVMSELDRAHRELLLAELEQGGQCVLTTADIGEVPHAQEISRVEIDAGRVVRAYPSSVSCEA